MRDRASPGRRADLERRLFQPEHLDSMDDFSRPRPSRLDETPLEPRSRARVLRRLQVLGAGRWHAPLGRRAGARVLVVCGQAGVGKSTVAANLAIALAG